MLKVAVIFGGHSSEYSVSLQSAYAVIRHIDRAKYEPVLVGITSAGEWLRFSGDIDRIPADTWHEADCIPAIVSPDRRLHGLLEFAPEGLRHVPLDAALPVLHGKNGEDGTVQGLLELAGIPVVGCGTLASALCMDKDMAHRLARAAGVRTPQSVLLHRGMGEGETGDLVEAVGFPLFVKPVRSGSSIGITRVTCREELGEAIRLAFEFDDRVLVEEGIAGFEIGCAVLGNTDLIIGEVDEIEIPSGFFDFTEKYNLIHSKIHMPARIPAEKAQEAKAMAAAIYRALGCAGFARVDMFLTPEGELVFNEVNTIPGFTAHSRYPNMLRGAGLSFAEVVDAIIGLAL